MPPAGDRGSAAVHRHYVPLSPFVDLPRQNRDEFVGEPLQALGLLIHVGHELVIENGRRYGGDEADCSREQGLGDARGHHRQRGGLLAGDGPKARHDAPNGPEQADKGAGRPNRRQHQKMALQAAISRWMVTSMTFSMRICRPPKERGWPSRLRFHSRIAATNSAAIEWVGREASAR